MALELEHIVQSYTLDLTDFESNLNRASSDYVKSRKRRSRQTDRYARSDVCRPFPMRSGNLERLSSTFGGAERAAARSRLNETFGFGNSNQITY